MVKIYIGNKPLFLVSERAQALRLRQEEKDVLFMEDPGTDTMAETIQSLEKGDASTGVILHDDIDALLASFKKHFKIIQAAGGLVYTDNREVLLIFRLGKWDLPKGKLDEGETLDACAAREIEEETGVGNLHLQSPLAITYHTYRHKGRHILKEAHWFLFHTPVPQPCSPQTEEDIEKCEWVKADGLTPYLENTYPAVLDVITKGVSDLQ